MGLPHVGVDPPAAIVVRERLHAYPAYVRLTIGTPHVVAAAIFLEIDITLWASFNAILLLPPTKGIVTTFQVGPMLIACQTFVELDVTRGADAVQARRALKRSPLLSWAVQDFAVWCWAVLKLLRMRMNICQERGFEKLIFLIR